jgi:putative heme-binding domain-containing protein
MGTVPLSASQAVAPQAASSRPAPVSFAKGERIALVGSGVAGRMGLFGHFETQLHARFPDKELVVRNFSWPADEVGRRQRPNDYTKLDDPLQVFGPDTFMCFFGLNESFAGPEGLHKYKADYEKYVQQMRKQYGKAGKTPRFLLVSPLAFESTGNPLQPDGLKENANLQLYAKATGEVALKLKLPFADLFTPTAKLFAEQPGAQFTIDGIHVNEAGDRAVSEALHATLFGDELARAPDYERLRAAVNDKSWVHHQDYRMLNGWYVYGGRNTPFGVHNFPLEFAKIRKMVAKRDRYVWDIAQGKAVPDKVDDSDTGELLDVKTSFGNRPYSEPPALRFLTGEESIKALKLAPGYEAQLVASEEQFPEIANPVQINFDGKGRLWVLCMPTYPQWTPGNPKPSDKIVILEDTNGDGRADKSQIFTQDLHVPVGFEFFNGGVLVVSQPTIMFMKDTDGDDVADVKFQFMDGFATDDTHHAIGAWEWGHGGLLYMMEGISLSTTVETPWGPFRNHNTSACYKLDPKTLKLALHVSPCFANPWMFTTNEWGQEFVGDGTGARQYWASPISGAPFPGRKTAKVFIDPGFRPGIGSEFIASRQFPDEAQGNYLQANVIGFQGIGQFKVREEGSGYAAQKIEPLIESTDVNFRPADPQFGPDGALYFADWHDPLIGHMQYSQRDPHRDKRYGRIYRIVAKGRPLLEPAIAEGRPIEAVLDQLKAYENRTRYRARRELRARETKTVLAAIATWVPSLDANDPLYEKHLAEALWVQQGHHAVDVALLKQLLRAKDYHARAAATRVLSDEWDRVPQPMTLIAAQVNDEHPRVRLEAVRALSFVKTPQAVELALQAANHPTDEYLNYTLDSTLGALTRVWEPRLTKKTIASTNPKGLAYLVDYNERRQPYGNERRLLQTLMNRKIDEKARETALKDLAETRGRAKQGATISARVCTPCHKVGGVGGEMGPDLTNVASRLNRIELIRSVLYPNEKIDPKFLVVNITTKKGAALSGFVSAEDERTVTMRLGAGEPRVLQKSDIAKRTTVEVSSMPEDLARTIPPQEFMDLIEYLASLR